MDQRIRAAFRRVAGYRDGLGRPVDLGIRRTVAYLNLLGFRTRMSCEGHGHRGSDRPNVDVERSREPRIEFVRQRSVLRTIRRAHGITRHTTDPKVIQAYREECCNAFDNGRMGGRTAAYRRWLRRHKIIHLRLRRLVDAFNENRKDPEPLQLWHMTVYVGPVHLEGRPWLTDGCRPTPKVLRRRQEVMREFTDFLAARVRKNRERRRR